MNKQTTRSLAIEWWENSRPEISQRVDFKVNMLAKYFPNGIFPVSEDKIISMYLSENPQTESEDVFKTKSYQQEPKVEDVQVGEWIVENNHIVNKELPGLIIASLNLLRDKSWEKDAKRIVQAVNNFDAMYSALKDTVYEYENAMKLLAEATGMIYSENNVTISAKAILNNIQ